MQLILHVGQIAGLLSPSGALVALGYGLRRARRVTDLTAFASIVTDIATPCLVFSVFAQLRLEPAAIAMTGLASIACLLSFASLSVCILSIFGLRIRAFLGPLSFPNTGNLGIPVAAAAFGTQGVAYATVFYTISSLANSVFGQALASGSTDYQKIARAPLLYAAILGETVSVNNVVLPHVLAQSANMVGQIAIPLMLIMLGAAIAELRVENLSRSLILSLFRLTFGAATGWVVAQSFHLGTMASGVLILQAAMPVAISSYLFAQRWSCEPGEVAAIVTISTIASCATTPLLMVFLNV